MRLLILTHRYLGILLGIPMSLWCLSGIVMIYAPYPRLDKDARVAALQEIEWGSIRLPPEARSPSAQRKVRDFQLAMLAGVPVLHMQFADGTSQRIDARFGRSLPAIDSDQAIAIAEQFAGPSSPGESAAHVDSIPFDQWTIAAPGNDRPLFKVSLGDERGTFVYVSAQSGMVVQATTRSQRFWGWLGAVPHWLYPTILRSHPHAWRQVIVWTSLLGGCTTVLGLLLGIIRLGPRTSARWIPYRGIMYWHHAAGLIFGILALTWVASGMLSMNPWGLMEGGDLMSQIESLQGPPQTAEQIFAAVQRMAQAHPPHLKTIDASRLGGRLFMIGTGDRQARYDANAQPAPLTTAEIESASLRIAGPGATSQLLKAEDAYHFSSVHQRIALPCIRVKASNGDYFYLDPVSARLIDRADSGDRLYRWWFGALHRLDFWAPLRSFSARTFLMLPVLLGVTMLTLIGTYIGLRRLARSN